MHSPNPTRGRSPQLQGRQSCGCRRLPRPRCRGRGAPRLPCAGAGASVLRGGLLCAICVALGTQARMLPLRRPRLRLRWKAGLAGPHLASGRLQCFLQGLVLPSVGLGSFSPAQVSFNRTFSPIIPVFSCIFTAVSLQTCKTPSLSSGPQRGDRIHDNHYLKIISTFTFTRILNSTHV